MAQASAHNSMLPNIHHIPPNGYIKKQATRTTEQENSLDTNKKCPEAPCRITDFIAYQVQTQPLAPAVQYGANESITYVGLSRLAAEIAVSLSIRRGTIVPICMDTSVNFIATIVATLMCSAAFVVLDSRGSIDRNNAIVDDCNAAIVIVDKLYAPLFENSVVLESALAERSQDTHVFFEDSDASAKDIAYLVYTSSE